MNRQETLIKTSQYRDLQRIYIELCANLIDILRPDNQIGIEIGLGDSITRNIKILGNPALMVFGYVENGEALLGKIDVYLLAWKDERQMVSTIYFDALRNWKTDIASASSLYSFNNQSDITNHLALEILSSFFQHGNP